MPSRTTSVKRAMPPLGAHMSVAGGYYKAVEAAVALGMEAVQIFSHSPSQWLVSPASLSMSGKGKPAPTTQPARTKQPPLQAKPNTNWQAKPINAEEVERFRAAFAASPLVHSLVHDSYLINIASPDDGVWQRSMSAFSAELIRAEALGIPFVVMHPGAYLTGTEESGLARAIAAFDMIHEQLPHCKTRCLIETTAGQGTCLGCKFEHLQTILEGVKNRGWLGVCVDTCHIFAAGYPLKDRKDYLSTMRKLDHAIGLEHVHAFHLNDSQKPQGSRVDRHAHIGQGMIGPEAFGYLMNDKRFQQVPMYLETPKGKRDGQDLDAINLMTLRNLAGAKR